VTAALLATFALLATPHHARPCVVHGRELRNFEHVTCAAAKPVLDKYVSTLKTSRAWQCHGYKGQTWRGYCETPDGKRYFTWRQLS
jgi:hypothetical protein